MSTRDLSPFARGAMTYEQRARLATHPAGGLRLAVFGTRWRFTVRLIDQTGFVVANLPDVGKAVLFERIAELLASVGHPLLEVVA